MGKDNELLEAARSGNLPVVEKILLSKAKRSGPLASLRRGPGANVQDVCGYSALHHAALNGHTEIIILLLQHDASPNLPDSRGSSPLHLAAWAGNHEIVKILLANQYKPANPNLQTIDKETPLHCAAQHGHTESLKILLLYGADPSVPNSKGETPLDLAAQYGRLKVVHILINEHPDLLTPYKYENIVDHSPLHLASRNGHKGVVEMLLAAGVEVNLQTPSGTALHEAALCGKEGVVMVLLEAGANLYSVNSDGRTVIDLLEQFPPHVTKGIISVIKNHKNSKSHQSNDRKYNSVGREYITSEGGKKIRNRYCDRNSDSWCSIGNSSTLNEASKDYYNSTIKSKSFSSSSDGNNLYITMSSIDSSKHTPPKKPPRRNYSLSPTCLQNNSLITMSLDIIDNQNYNGKDIQTHSPYEYLCLSKSGSGSIRNEPYMQMKPVQPSNSVYYENLTTGMRILNPNRKLKRNKNRFIDDIMLQNQSKNLSYIVISDSTPTTPTHFNQPPTPEHPPPTPNQAELLIHEVMRPLSQEYKRKSKEVTETGTSPPDNLSTSLNASSASLSSSFSLSDRSVSTDCVEEYIGDVPFAGLIKGSSSNIEIPNIFNYKSGKIERPKTLKTTSEDIFRLQSDQDNKLDKFSSYVQSTNQVNYDSKSFDILSPFDEQEEWTKISEIITSFGESFFLDSKIKKECELIKQNTRVIQSTSQNITTEHLSIKQWLEDIGLSHIETNFIENGFDDIEFINNILSEEDFEKLNVSENDVPILTKAIKELPQPKCLAINLENEQNSNLNNNLPNSITLEKWLKDIKLESYIETFKKHLYVDISRIFRVWDVELQTVLEINKLGHRKRILYSIYGCNNSPSYNNKTLELSEMQNTKLVQSSKSNNSQQLTNSRSVDLKESESNAVSSNNANNISSNNHRNNRKKTRPAPKPPLTRLPNLDLRAPSELLLGFPTGLKTQWRHPVEIFITSYIKYNAYYLGSTLVKELRGTESTRKSIQKLKRGERFSQNSQISSNNGVINNQDSLNLIRQPICLAISFCGVKFIDIETDKVICEHEIKNIDCACQDSDDLTHFAYITKDVDTQYCHVFNVDSMDLATEIILTLGQAFEVAYQIALREINPLTPSRQKQKNNEQNNTNSDETILTTTPAVSSCYVSNTNTSNSFNV